MEKEYICDVFRQAFEEVTQKLTTLSLEETDLTDSDIKDDKSTEILIYATGKLDAKVKIFFSDQVYKYIVESMYGGNIPTEEEEILYIKEYVNIVCGYAISILNNNGKGPSKLTVPYLKSEDPERIKDGLQHEQIHYDSGKGDLVVDVSGVYNEKERGGK